ncbi:sulfite exporter TauE/SafE family protein [Siccirubricoccus sp. G192]|uniref:urease accessory protein UreH domain-containing protein n=1 Tax=Siccirubricoccus sp. G192 TaxID=2849651 RepID=UPI001C2BEC37|nr:sulfite exporter TauE/SafE family protein [Siccirubricoccus sp. G192]MBV1797054.1 sulfite exporter TauE/SafE family protein [Siccirubricoccus sp. G192]
MFANCLHSLAALGPGGLAALMGALFLAGLAGGATHCATMCAPFVLAQAAAGADRSAGGGVLRRLSGAALLPYHCGRMLGYAALGGLAGGAAGLVAMASGLRLVLAALLVLAAVLMLAQASHRLAAWLPRPAPRLTPRLPAVLERRLGALLAAPGGGRGVLLGLLLSALPCGLLYGALAAAAASGSALAGALAMAAFVLGTMPALMAVALLGRFFGRRQGPALRLGGAMLFAFNGVVLLSMAVRLVA